MKSLDKVSKLGVELSENDLKTIEGRTSYKNKWWYKTLTAIRKVAEEGSDLWQLKFPQNSEVGNLKKDFEAMNWFVTNNLSPFI